jgi:hypothetical protein
MRNILAKPAPGENGSRGRDTPQPPGREGLRLPGVGQYGKVSVPLTILTLALGIAWLRFVRY